MDESLTPTRPHAVPVPPSRALQFCRALWPAVPWVLLVLTAFAWSAAEGRANRADWTLRKVRMRMLAMPEAAFGTEIWQVPQLVREIDRTLGDSVLADSARASFFMDGDASRIGQGLPEMARRRTAN